MSDLQVGKQIAALAEIIPEIKAIGVGLMGEGAAGWAMSGEEASRALSLGRAQGGEERVWLYSKIVLEESVRGTKNALRYLVSLVEQLASEPDLLETLKTFFDQLQRRKVTASVLGIHPNTLNYQVKGFIVENKTTSGFSVKKIENKIALRVVQNGVITLDNCRVPEENRLQGDLSFRDTARVLRLTRQYVAWESVGCSMGAYEHALRYAQTREQFGKPIASFQMVQDLLAKMLGNITASQCMVVRLAQLQDQGKLLDQHASLAKAFCTTRMRETVAWAREIFGGNGIVPDYNVARFFADAEALYSYEGTREMNSLIVGKAVTGFSAFA
jgi:hypothetical protein